MNKLLSRLAALAGVLTVLSWGLRAASRQKARISFTGKSVVITGGSRGLGLVLARKFAMEGARVTLIARDEEGLQKARQELLKYGAEVEIEACDISDRYQVEQTMGRIVRRFGRIDVLVNNAGIIQVGPIEHMRIEDFEDAMGVHFWGPLYAILSSSHYMRQQGGGRIVNIASVGGKVAVPHLAPYIASKFAMVGLSDAMRTELSKENILVTTVSPGLMRTGSYVNALFKGRNEEEYTWFSLFDAIPVTSTSAESAARQIINACRHGEPELTITPQARLLVLTNAIFPRFSAAALKLFDRLLPRPTSRSGDVARPGYESQSKLSPSPLTAMGDRAAEEHNELLGREPLA